ncbi:Non-catalytic module family DOC2 [Piromyces sp. E2]|nr:Non-catalytic module family DOC2 [Piromyces sp. E2]|eukprot:OUM58440.1 Non-catalytic module family DOC2 [Piromyces sp. E2]
MYFILLLTVLNLIKWVTSLCPINILNQGYNCCRKDCIVYYTDKDGDWGYEDDQWCGCGDSDKPKTCDPEILKMGYTCCNHCNVNYNFKIDSKDPKKIIWSVLQDGTKCVIPREYCANIRYHDSLLKKMNMKNKRRSLNK